jgi:hypothetical protein
LPTDGVDRYFIADKIENRLVCYFGNSIRVGIWQKIELLGESSFAWPNLESIAFEHESRLIRIEDSCLTFDELREICVPSTVRYVASNIFDHPVKIGKCTADSIAENAPGAP